MSRQEETTLDELWNRIGSDPDICHGKPCIKGTRIPVYLVVQMVAQGVPEAEILRDYPSLQPLDIRAALHYAARLCDYEAHAI